MPRISMFSRLQWLLLQLSRRLWVRATAFSVLGIVTALHALQIKHDIPDDIPATIGADASAARVATAAAR